MASKHQVLLARRTQDIFLVCTHLFHTAILAGIGTVKKIDT